MATREITAHCAICGRKPKDPESPDCPCETRALRKAIEASEKKWLDSWMARVHDWVTNAAVHYITSTFETLKQRRIQNYSYYVNSLPNYQAYRQYHGRPPIFAPALTALIQQLKAADRDLQRGINEDWRALVQKYPEVLDHYYSHIEVAIPSGTIDPPFNGHGAPIPGATPSFAGSGGSTHKGRKSGARSSVPPNAFEEEILMRRESHRHKRRDSGSYVVSGRNRAPVAPTPPVAPSYPFGL